MNKTARRNTLRLGIQMTELMFAAPQVVAHRLARMAAADAGVSRRDRREFSRMSSEKFAAFGESWSAMAFQMVKANQQMAQALMLDPWLSLGALSKGALPRSSIAQQAQRSALRIASSGLAPVRKRAVANAKRLRQIKSR